MSSFSPPSLPPDPLELQSTPTPAPPAEPMTATSSGEDGLPVEIESGAEQLLSTAFPSGVSDPFSTTVAGWTTTGPAIEALTGFLGGFGIADPFGGGQNVDSFSGLAVEDNPNAFTGGQSVDPASGVQNAVSSAGGGETAVPALTLDFGIPASDLNTVNTAAADYYAGSTGTPASTDNSPSLADSLAQYAIGLGAVNAYFSDGVLYAVVPGRNDVAIAEGPLASAVYLTWSANREMASAGVPDAESFPALGVLRGPPSSPSPSASTATSSVSAPPPSSPPPDPGPPLPALPEPPPPPPAASPGLPTMTTDPTQGQQLSQTTLASETAAPQQREEENLHAAEAGFWDSVVDDIARGIVGVAIPGVGALGQTLLAPKVPLGWARAGPPQPTGDPDRDSQLLDNYNSGRYVYTTVSNALAIVGPGILNSASSAASKLPGLAGAGIGGGKWIGWTEQWLSNLREPSGSLPPELQESLSKADSANLQHVLTGGPGDRGIGVLHIDVSELSPAEIQSTIDAVRDMDFQSGMAGGLVRTAVPSRSVANSAAALGKRSLSLGPFEAAGHVPDVAGGGNPLGPIMGMERGVNASIGGQWGRYAPGFTFDGFSLVDRATGEFLYSSHALEDVPAPILNFRF